MPSFKHGFIRFDDGPPETRWAISDPTDESLDETLHRMWYNPDTLTEVDRWRVMAAAEAYQHLTTYPLGVQHCIGKLREIRRAIRSKFGA